LAKLYVRPTKSQIRKDYDWDRDEENLADTVAHYFKTYLFPGFKFLKEGWQEYNICNNSSFLLVRKKVKIAEEADYKDHWDRVIYLIIRLKYNNMRCNLNSEIQNFYKSE
jgi:hypothetical protein